MTPHVAIAVYGAVILAVAFALHLYGWTSLTIFGDAGTLAAFGFLLAYFTITVAAPVYLRRLGELRPRDLLVAVAGFACLLVPTVGSFYPAPPAPINLFPYIFLGYMLVGAGWLAVISRRQPGTLRAIERALEESLEASAHELALDEESHRHHAPERVPQVSPAPAN
jgi:amino acid transporter